MNSLDIRVLSIWSLATSLLLVLAMYLIGRISGRNAAIAGWTRGATLLGGGFVLIALRGVVPDAISIVLANVLIALGSAWLYLAMRLSIGLALGPRLDLAAAAVVLLLFPVFTYVLPNLGIRITINSTIAGGFALACSWLALAAPEARRDPDHPVLAIIGLSFLANGATHLARAAMAAVAPTDGDLLASRDGTDALVFLAISLHNAVLIFGVSYLVGLRTARELRAATARFEATFDQAAVGIGLFALDGRWMRVNHKLCTMLAASADELMAQGIDDVTAAEHAAETAADCQRMLSGSIASVTREQRYRRHDQSLVWGRRTTTLVRDEHGQADHFVAVIEDIDARKQTEAELLATQSAAIADETSARRAALSLMEDSIAARKRAEASIDELRRSEQRFNDIANASADWIWEMDTDNRYTYASDGVEFLIGHSAAEIIGKTPFDFMPPDEAARVRAEFEAIVRARRPFRDLDNTNLHKDGTLRHVTTSGTPVLDDDGQLLGYRGVDRDITARKTAEIELRERNAELERFNRATTGRELDMIRLKREINALSAALGRNPPYDLAFLDPALPATGESAS